MSTYRLTFLIRNNFRPWGIVTPAFKSEVASGNSNLDPRVFIQRIDSEGLVCGFEPVSFVETDRQVSVLTTESRFVEIGQPALYIFELDLGNQIIANGIASFKRKLKSAVVSEMLDQHPFTKLDVASYVGDKVAELQSTVKCMQILRRVSPKLADAWLNNVAISSPCLEVAKASTVIVNKTVESGFGEVEIHTSLAEDDDRADSTEGRVFQIILNKVKGWLLGVRRDQVPTYLATRKVIDNISSAEWREVDRAIDLVDASISELVGLAIPRTVGQKYILALISSATYLIIAKSLLVERKSGALAAIKDLEVYADSGSVLSGWSSVTAVKMLMLRIGMLKQSLKAYEAAEFYLTRGLDEGFSYVHPAPDKEEPDLVEFERSFFVLGYLYLSKVHLQLNHVAEASLAVSSAKELLASYERMDKGLLAAVYFLKAKVCLSQDQFREAKDLIGRSVENFELATKYRSHDRLQPCDDIDLGNALFLSAEIEMSLGMMPETLSLIEKALIVLEQKHGAHSPVMADALVLAGQLERSVGDKRKAHKHLDDARIIYEVSFGPDHQSTKYVNRRIAEILLLKED